MPNIKNPHDLFFKASFRRSATARAFCRHYLPPEIAGSLDLETLEVKSGDFVDKRLRAHFTDLLYQIALRGGGTAHIYLLLEHKSAPDEGVVLQLGRYLFGLLERLQREGAQRLPLVLPVVLYHGKAAWHVPECLSALFEIPAPASAWQPFVPELRYHLSCLGRRLLPNASFGRG